MVFLFKFSMVVSLRFDSLAHIFDLTLRWLVMDAGTHLSASTLFVYFLFYASAFLMCVGD